MKVEQDVSVNVADKKQDEAKKAKPIYSFMDPGFMGILAKYANFLENEEGSFTDAEIAQFGLPARDKAPLIVKPEEQLSMLASIMASIRQTFESSEAKKERVIIETMRSLGGLADIAKASPPSLEGTGAKVKTSEEIQALVKLAEGEDKLSFTYYKDLVDASRVIAAYPQEKLAVEIKSAMQKFEDAYVAQVEHYVEEAKAIQKREKPNLRSESLAETQVKRGMKGTKDEETIDKVKTLLPGEKKGGLEDVLPNKELRDFLVRYKEARSSFLGMITSFFSAKARARNAKVEALETAYNEYTQHSGTYSCKEMAEKQVGIYRLLTAMEPNEYSTLGNELLDVRKAFVAGHMQMVAKYKAAIEENKQFEGFPEKEKELKDSIDIAYKSLKDVKKVKEQMQEKLDNLKQLDADLTTQTSVAAKENERLLTASPKNTDSYKKMVKDIATLTNRNEEAVKAEIEQAWKSELEKQPRAVVHSAEVGTVQQPAVVNAEIQGEENKVSYVQPKGNLTTVKAYGEYIADLNTQLKEITEEAQRIGSEKVVVEAAVAEATLSMDIHRRQQELSQVQAQVATKQLQNGEINWKLTYAHTQVSQLRAQDLNFNVAQQQAKASKDMDVQGEVSSLKTGASIDMKPLSPEQQEVRNTAVVKAQDTIYDKEYKLLMDNITEQNKLASVQDADKNLELKKSLRLIQPLIQLKVENDALVTKFGKEDKKLQENNNKLQDEISKLKMQVKEKHGQGTVDVIVNGIKFAEPPSSPAKTRETDKSASTETQELLKQTKDVRELKGKVADKKFANNLTDENSKLQKEVTLSLGKLGFSFDAKFDVKVEGATLLETKQANLMQQKAFLEKNHRGLENTNKELITIRDALDNQNKKPAAKQESKVTIQPKKSPTETPPADDTPTNSI